MVSKTVKKTVSKTKKKKTSTKKITKAQVLERQKKRTSRAQKMDKHKNAKNILKKDEWYKWLKAPNRFDIEGIDTKDTKNSPTRKKQVSTTRKTEVTIRRICKFGDPDYPYKTNRGISAEGKKKVTLKVFEGIPSVSPIIKAGIIKKEEEIVRDSPTEFVAKGNKIYHNTPVPQLEVELRAYSPKYDKIIAVYKNPRGR